MVVAVINTRSHLSIEIVILPRGGDGDGWRGPAYTWRGVKESLTRPFAWFWFWWITLRDRKVHTLGQKRLYPSWLKGFWDRSDLVNLDASGCRILGLLRRVLVTLAPLVLLFSNCFASESKTIILNKISLFLNSYISYELSTNTWFNNHLMRDCHHADFYDDTIYTHKYVHICIYNIKKDAINWFSRIKLKTNARLHISTSPVSTQKTY